MDAEAFDARAVVAETIDFLTVRDDAEGRLRGDTPSWFGDRLFGGFVVGQAVHAATRAAPEGKRIHSLHGYFLRAVLAGPPLIYDTTVVKDGRSFASRRLDVSQAGAAVFTMMCSFTADTDGYEYEMPGDAATPPADADIEVGPGPWASVGLGPTPRGADGTYRSTSRTWLRAAAPLPDDPALHAAFVGFLSDMTGTGGRPLQLEGDITGMVSLDHSVWFHRPVRADEWLYYDVHSVINTGGRGLIRGAMRDADGRLAVSVAQEMLLAVVG